jgi:HK97 family phage prohead protease
MNDFNFIIPLQKGLIGDTLTGTASTTSVDRDEERMSANAINNMTDGVKREGVNLFGNHQHDWENILGGIDNAEAFDKKFKININLNKANPKYEQLVGTLNTKGVRIGLSVGGNVKSFHWEYDKAIGKKIKVLDEVEVYEVSVVGIPSNKESFLTIPQAIAKSAKLPGMPPIFKCVNCNSEVEKGVCALCLTRY